MRPVCILVSELTILRLFPHSELVRNWAFLLLFLIHIESNLQYNAQKKALFRHQVYRIFHCGECQARFTVFCGTFIILLSTHGKTPKASQRPSTGLRASEAPILTWMTWKRCWATWVTSRSIRRPHVQKWARSIAQLFSHYQFEIYVNHLDYQLITDNHW